MVIACENSPNSTTISGDLDVLEQVQREIIKNRSDVLVRPLKVDIAYHSHHMKSLGGRYLQLIEGEFSRLGITLKAPEVAFYSRVSKNRIQSAKEIAPFYWGPNLTFPVLFNSATNKLLQDQQNNVFVEVGPHSTLAGPLRQICSNARSPNAYIPTMLRNKNCMESLLSAFGQLYQQGIFIDFEPLVPSGKALTDLPRYSWDHNASYWYENRVSKDWRFRSFGYHGILGLRIPESTSIEPCWRNVLHVEDEAWLYDHKIREDIVFPFAGYVAMAGEAIRQITGIDSGYGVRHVVAHTALVLSDNKPTEMVTSLRPHRLTDSSCSDYWDFAISSYSGSTWIKNCEGRVKAQHGGASAAAHELLVRKVEPSRWYTAMGEIGIVYGPEFQRLSHITSSTTEKLAVGTVTSTKGQVEAPFLFHPTALDACLQLLLVALAKGIGRNFTRLQVPTVIEELDISRGASVMDAKAWSSDDGKIGIECIANNKTALRLSGIQLTALDEEELMTMKDKHAAARLEWRPHFDFMDQATLFQPPVSNPDETRLQEEMTLLCVIDSVERLEGLEACQPHFNKLRPWLESVVQQAESGRYPLVEGSQLWPSIPVSKRREMIEDRFARLSAISNKDAVAEGIRRIWENMEAIFTGKRDTLDLLMEGNILTKIYNVVSFGHSGFIQMLSHAKPDLRILEVGAGTGGTTQTFLHDLADTGGYPKYSRYTFTDISAGFFPQAKERFSYAPNMDYMVFDISQSPFQQGFEAESYDLILAPNVIHATPVLQDTLKNLQPLLRKNGHLVLTELSAVVRTPNYIFGNFSGWWLRELDGRPNEPYVSVGRWDQELKAAGFSGVDTAVYDAVEPYQYCAAIVSQPVFTSEDPTGTRQISIVCDNADNTTVRSLINRFKGESYMVSVLKIGDPSIKGNNIVSTLDLESHFFENISEERFTAFRKILRSTTTEKILWLTSPSQISCKNPRSAPAIGMGRTIRSELAVPYFTLEIDIAEVDFCDLVTKVFKKVETSEDTEALLPDREYAVHDGIIYVGRYHPFSLSQELNERVTTGPAQVKTLNISKLGLLETLEWVEESYPDELRKGEVEIESRAIGLNFRDIVFAIGIIPSGADGVPLGLEITGIVRRLGSDIGDLRVGDRVFALAPHGCITTNAVLPAPLVVKIPDRMSFEEAATMPICFATAVYALRDIGRLERGNSVLIHNAAGGVGHAAIQICKMMGAEIYATTGSDVKVEYLVSTLGISRNRIFNSRDISFVSDLMHATDGRGVDVVLNSLSGELLHGSWKCVAEFGKMIELGKRDLAGFGQLDMQTFLANRSYCCVDIAHLTRERPTMMGRLLRQCLEWYTQGMIEPIHPTALFDADKAEHAFRSLQKGDLIGKAVITMPGDASDITGKPYPRALKLDSKATYLMTGGLGGLGKPIVTWMVERGARSFVFLSRTAGSRNEDQAFFEELGSLGCNVATVSGKVQDIDDVNKAISMAEYPIKGIMHLAMVLKDAPIVDMTHADWTAAIAPKVDGAWNLHQAFKEHALDFFFLASSLVTVVDQPGQGNYNASNTFLEAFCQFRQNLGLPASVLNICPIEGIGFVAENPQARKNLKAQGLYFLGEQELLDYIELCILRSYPTPEATGHPSSWQSSGQIVMGLRSELHLDDPNNRTNWRRDRRMAMYHNMREQESGARSSKSNELEAFLARAALDPEVLAEKSSAEYLSHEIGRKVLGFMLRPDEEDVDISLGLSQIGLDSLMAIELRRWWKQAFGLDISVLEIMASGTLEQLGRVAAEGSMKRLRDGSAGS